MMSLGEMATWLPLPGAIPHFCGRYVDEAMGFAVGWNVSYPNLINFAKKQWRTREKKCGFAGTDSDE